ncbi:OB fold domain-containing protein [Aspergillus lucknowensis]|uniref:RecQ-mediated genome instability protein 1 n=1 Tax=Aspergillus lucknowensis TaxID=176173 RepID=A0ABR4LMS2_9EURO
MANLKDQIATELLRTKSLPVSQPWLDNFLSSSSTAQRNTPLPALTRTALFRILTSDFRESLASRNATILPVDIADPNVQERRLPGCIPVQVLDIEDIGTSAWSQIEAIERVERGETVRGREIVRTVNIGGDEDQGGATGSGNRATAACTNAGMDADANESGGPHRLVLQDAKGTRVMGIEMKKITGFAIGRLSIGAKLLLRDSTVARGMVLLTPENVTLLGGKIEAMDQAWKTGRKERLLEKINGTGGGT